MAVYGAGLFLFIVRGCLFIAQSGLCIARFRVAVSFVQGLEISSFVMTAGPIRSDGTRCPMAIGRATCNIPGFSPQSFGNPFGGDFFAVPIV